MKTYRTVALVLVVVGAVNWGLVGALGTNLVSSLLGDGSLFEKVVYLLVGASGLYVAYLEWGTAKRK